MARILLSMFGLLFLAGCMDVISSNEKSIAIQYDTFTKKEAFAAAEKHCSKFGTVAVATVPSGPGNDYVGIFECR